MKNYKEIIKMKETIAAHQIVIDEVLYKILSISSSGLARISGRRGNIWPSKGLPNFEGVRRRESHDGKEILKFKVLQYISNLFFFGNFI